MLYEVNARCWLREQRTTLGSVPESAIAQWRADGFTHLWLMGVWRTAPASVRFSRKLFSDETLTGSPYAIAGYEVDPDLGDNAGLAKFRARLAERRLKLILDFIPNHTGLDHPWTKSHPQRFITDRNGSIAHGKDPYFPAWADTAQLDLRNPDTRQALVAQLLSVAERCDGVRCDMAMLVLNDVFVRNWGGATPAAEFWSEAISSVKAAYPNFVFIGEVYWDLEQRLLDLGFDYVYDKTFLDRVRAGRSVEYLSSRCPEFLQRSVPFLENHDEERIASMLSLAEHRAAASLLLSLPGLPMVHEGQIDGAKIRASVHASRRAREVGNPEIKALYQELFRARQVDPARRLSLNA